MKKALILFMSLLMVFAIVACGEGAPQNSPSSPPPKPSQTNSSPVQSSTPSDASSPAPDSTNPTEAPMRESSTSQSGSSILVVYFSQPDEVDDSTVVINGETLGNTQYMANVIQDTTGADIFRITPEAPYPTEHEALVDLASEEQTNAARPAIAESIENFDNYETILVGYPNWWGDMPMILYTFFDTYDFSGKTIIPFNTHGGSGFSGTINTIKELEPEAQVLEGHSISRNVIQAAEQEIVDWITELGFAK